MAAVLTAVLQNHLAWVSTVMPAGTAPSRAFLDKHSSKTVSLNVLLLVVEIYCLNKGCLPCGGRIVLSNIYVSTPISSCSVDPHHCS